MLRNQKNNFQIKLKNSCADFSNWFTLQPCRETTQHGQQGIDQQPTRTLKIHILQIVNQVDLHQIAAALDWVVGAATRRDGK